MSKLMFPTYTLERKGIKDWDCPEVEGISLLDDDLQEDELIEGKSGFGVEVGARFDFIFS